jgi:hypothetical protein
LNICLIVDRFIGFGAANVFKQAIALEDYPLKIIEN